MKLAAALLDWHTRTQRPFEFIEEGETVRPSYQAEENREFGVEMEKLFARLFDEAIRGVGPRMIEAIKPPTPEWARKFVEMGVYAAPGEGLKMFSEGVERIPELVMGTFGLNDFSDFKQSLTGNVYCVGSGSSHQHARFLFDILRKEIKQMVRVYVPTGLVEEDLVKSGDTVILFSQGGLKPETLDMAEYARQRGARLIVFTANPTTPILEHASKKYYYPPDWEICPTKTQGTAAAYAALIDLYAALSCQPIDRQAIYYQLLSTLFTFNDRYRATPGSYLFLPSDDLYVLAQEGQLKVSEGPLLPALVLRPGQFIHGEHLSWRRDPLATFVLMSSSDDKPELMQWLMSTYLQGKPVIDWRLSVPWPQSALVQAMNIIMLTQQLFRQTGVDPFYPPGIGESTGFHHHERIIPLLMKSKVESATAPAVKPAGYLDATFKTRAFAEAWDGVQTGSSIDQFPRSLASALKNGAEVLEVGTGTGKAARRIARAALDAGLRDVRIVGVDQSADMLAVAMEQAKQLPGINFEWLQGDATQLTTLLADRLGKFDAITGRYSFQLIDVGALSPQLIQLLRPGGILSFNMVAVNYFYDFEKGVFSPEFANTNPFKAALYE